jgi:hypothetical protein
MRGLLLLGALTVSDPGVSVGLRGAGERPWPRHAGQAGRGGGEHRDDQCGRGQTREGRHW